MRVLVLLCLVGCKLDALLKPQPVLKWGCIEYQGMTVSWRDSEGNEHGVWRQWCVREGWTR